MPSDTIRGLCTPHGINHLGLRALIEELYEKIEKLEKRVAYLQEQIDRPDWRSQR